MRLTIDIGNSSCKVGVFQGTDLVFDAAVEPTADQIETLLSEHAPSSVIVSSVRESDTAINDVLTKLERCIYLDHNTPLPITSRYRTPETLGNDRRALVVGGSAMYPGEDLLILDAGTALTFDFIDRQRIHQGGAISPGMTMRLQGLHTFTGRLPLLEPEMPAALTGVDTKGSILSGVVHGMVLEMEGVISRYRADHPNLRVLLTGGDGAFFESMLKSEIFAHRNLVLHGLNDILAHNEA
jgi:type III pantothenate kinase